MCIGRAGNGEGTYCCCSNSSRAFVGLRALGFLTSSPEVKAPPLSRLMGDDPTRLKYGSRTGLFTKVVWFARMCSSRAVSKSAFRRLS